MSKLEYFVVHDPKRDGAFACLIESCDGIENCVGEYGARKRLRKKLGEKKERLHLNTKKRAQRRADKLNRYGP